MATATMRMGCLPMITLILVLGGCEGPPQPHVVSKLSDPTQVVVERYGSHGADEDLGKLAISYCENIGKRPVLESTNINSSINVFGWRSSRYSCVPDLVAQADATRQRQELQRVEAETRTREAELHARETQRQLDRLDDDTCLSFGVKRGTTPYTDCRLKLRSERVSAVAAQLLRGEASRIAVAREQQAREAQLQALRQQEAEDARRNAVANEAALRAAAGMLAPAPTFSQSLSNGFGAAAGMPLPAQNQDQPISSMPRQTFCQRVGTQLMCNTFN